MKQIRFGMIGAGQIAQYCVEEINRHPHSSVVAAYTRNPERLAAFCASFSIMHTYATIDALLADPTVDAVYIALPTKFHAPVAMQALAAGKHVLLEKPLAMNRAEAEDLARVARQSGRVFMQGMNQRFDKDHQQIRALVKQGVLGDIYHAKGVWLRRSGIPALGTWFGSKAMAGGGCLYDIGVHLLDLCLYTLDNFEPVSVSGATYTKFGNRGLGEGDWGASEREELVFDVDDFASAFIRLANGATVSLDVAWACHQAEEQQHNVTLYGTEGGATLRPAKLFHNQSKQEDANLNASLIDNASQAIEFPHCSRFHHFINHILGKESLCITLEQVLVVQKILDGIVESSRTGREVYLQPSHNFINKKHKSEESERVYLC